MNYLITKSHTQLSRFIQYYWTLESCQPNYLEHIQRIVPNGLLEIIFYFGERPTTIQCEHKMDDNAILSGQLKDYYDMKFTGSYSLFSVLLKPQGLSMFTSIPISEFYNQNIPLKDVFSNDFNQLEDLLWSAKSFTERVNITNQFFFNQLQHCQSFTHFNRIEHCINTINQFKGNVGINSLVSESCLSRKQFERVFAHCVGASPKQFLKTVRFQNTLNEKSKYQNISLTELAYQCGYYDQSHMINDFQQLSGLSPKAYFDECEPISDYFCD